MINKNDQIELRSEKVRNIIGQIPPRLIRSGISIMFLVLIIMFIISYFFKYPYRIEVEFAIYQDNSKMSGYLMVPANEIKNVSKGQNVVLKLNNIPHMYDKNIHASIDSVSTIINLDKTGGFYSVRLKIPESPTINLSERMFGKADVVIGNMSFWKRVREK